MSVSQILLENGALFLILQYVSEIELGNITVSFCVWLQILSVYIILLYKLSFLYKFSMLYKCEKTKTKSILTAYNIFIMGFVYLN